MGRWVYWDDSQPLHAEPNHEKFQIKIGQAAGGAGTAPCAAEKYHRVRVRYVMGSEEATGAWLYGHTRSNAVWEGSHPRSLVLDMLLTV